MFSVVVLSGGRASRLGRDKASTLINGVTMMERIFRTIPNDAQVIVVGEYLLDSDRDVIVTRESPVGAGPLAALTAGVAEIAHDQFLLLAVDMPFVGDIGQRLLELLRDSPTENDAIIPIDSVGNLQPLCAAYRTESVRNALSSVGIVVNGSIKRLLGELHFETLNETDPWMLSDVDTPKDLQDARDHARSTEGARPRSGT
ncbi:MAG TPA: molybdenum cofactor guanylyltransferase [Candidatus Nanopelagicaceae bacterium]|nr:molybdenum cofactor guanylyltransferase [Candidatus Nanopelagicaceae bacterium]